VHGAVTIEGYLENKLLLYRHVLAADRFEVERLDKTRWENDDWFQVKVRIMPHGLRQNLRSFTTHLEAILCGDPNIVLLERDGA
jgi:hypothetical protein